MASKPRSKARRPAKKREPRKNGRPAHVVTDTNKAVVMMMVADGKTHPEIARVLGCCERTLRNHYRAEIDTGSLKANAMVTSTLYQNATGGGNWQKANMTAAIWWDKTRNGKGEPKQQIEHSGAVGTYDLDKLSKDELLHLKSILSPIAVSGADRSGDSSEGSAGAA